MIYPLLFGGFININKNICESIVSGAWLNSQNLGLVVFTIKPPHFDGFNDHFVFSDSYLFCWLYGKRS